MKKLLIMTFMLISGLCSAQTFSPDVVKGHVKGGTELKLKSGGSNTGYIPMTLTTPALQLTFTQVEKINGTWTITTPITIGYSYIYSFANGVIHPDSSITVESKFFFGGGIDFGVRPNETGVLVGMLPVGAIVGYSRYGLFGGIDALNGKPMIAVSLNLLNFPVLQSLTKFNIK